MIAQVPEGSDVPAGIPMVFCVATGVWVEHSEAEQEMKRARSSHARTIGDRLA